MKNYEGIEGGKVRQNVLCVKCENVSHVLWECSAYSSTVLEIGL